jgi:hypothetical protein
LLFSRSSFYIRYSQILKLPIGACSLKTVSAPVGATDARAEVELTMRVAVDSMFAFCWLAIKFDMDKGHGVVEVLNFAKSWLSWQQPVGLREDTKQLRNIVSYC